MLDALLAALPDSSYFQQKNFGEGMREKLFAEDVPFAAYLRGAAVWDQVTHASYPVYSICKTNTEDNAGHNIDFGNAVLSSVETGELLVFRMREHPGKIPMAAAPEAPRTPGNRTIAKSYSVDDQWREFKGDDLRGGYGSYQAFLRAGNFQSSPFMFKVIPDPGSPAERLFDAELRAGEPSGKRDSGIQGATFSIGPGALTPKDPGLTLVHGKPYIEHGIRHFPVSGSFRFAFEWPKDFARMPLHILVSERNVGGLGVNTLWIPRSKCRFKDGAYSGQFNFDLASLFVYADGISRPPKEAWISAVHRGWQGPIVKVVLPPAP